MAGNDSPKLNNQNGERPEKGDLNLLRLQDFLLSGELPPKPAPPAAHELSVEELEALLAQKRREAARHTDRQLRTRQSHPSSPAPISPEPLDRPPVSAAPPARNGPPSPTSAARFEPASLVARQKKGQSGVRLRNVLGYTLETLVIVAALVLFGNWGLQQAGVSLNLLGPAPVTDFFVLPSRAGGVYLSANAASVIELPATVTPMPPTATTLPTVRPGLASSPAVAPTSTPVPTRAAPLAVAPTPTPLIVQPVQQSLAQGAAPPPSPARRLLIPKLGLDTTVQEVTVNLGNWQVADNVAGYHVGTAFPGRPGNMVLAGHRDIRGSIFLRLNEMQPGDEFRVVTDVAVHRYVVTEIVEVAPTEVAVMSPTVDPTATLITCTPIGLATKRLVVKARLEK